MAEAVLSNPTLSIGGALFLLAYGALVAIALRRPLLLRIAVREALRRPGQSVLIVVGLMVASSSIAAALEVGDTFNGWLTANALRDWGRVDVLVNAGSASFPRSVPAQLAGASRLQSTVSGVQGGVELVGSVADLDRELDRSAVRLTAFDPVSQPAFGAFGLSDGTRTFGQTLGNHQVLVSRKLAELLDARSGDRLRIGVNVNGADRTLDVNVGGVALPNGPGAYGLQPSVFMTLEAMSSLTGSDAINVVRITAKGSGQDEVDNSRQAVPVVRSVLKNSSLPFRVEAVKAADLDAQTTQSAVDRGILIVLSLLAVVAALMLAVNLAIALAEERRPRLGILRAMGLSRAGLIQTAALEGALYSLAGAVLSIGPGLTVGLLVAQQFARFSILGPGSPGLPDADLALQVPVKLTTIFAAITFAALLLLGTVVSAAFRTSRMTIVTAIRNLPEPVDQRGWLWPSIVSYGLLGIGGVLAVATNDLNWRLFGGIALVLVAARLTRRFLPRALQTSALGLALVIWALVWTVTANIAPFFATVTSVVGLALIVVSNLRVFELGIRLLGGRASRFVAILHPPLAYLTRRPVRTGLTAVGFGLLITTIVTMSGILQGSAAYLNTPLAYDVRVSSSSSSTIELPDSVMSKVSTQLAIPTRSYVGPLDTAAEGHENVPLNMYALTPDFVANPPVQLRTRYGHYPDDPSVWRAMLRDPRLIVTSANWGGCSGGSPGCSTTLAGSNGPVRFQTVGLTAPVLTPANLLEGLIASPEALQPFATRPAGVTVLLKLKPGNDATQVAKDIQRSLYARGVEAVSTHDLFVVPIQATHVVASTLELFLSLGLITGVLALGILAFRAVIERRHAIGLLRALGFQAGQILIGQFAENGLTVTVGIVLGMTMGTFWAHGGIQALVSPTVGFPLDWANLGLLLALIYGTLIVVTAIPAAQASRLPPAQALRLTE